MTGPARRCPAKPPVPPPEPLVEVRHGHAREVPWPWLRDREDPRTRAHLEAENAHTEAWLAPVADRVEALYREMVGRIVEDDDSVPAARDGWSWWRRLRRGWQYPAWLRRPVEGGEEQVVLDPNALAEEGGYLGVGAVAPAPGARLVAALLDREGGERHVLRVHHIPTGEVLREDVGGLADSVAWFADGRSLLVVERDAAERPYRVLRVDLDGGPPEPLYEEPDPRFHVEVRATRSRRFLLIESHSITTSEVRILPADGSAPPALAWPRRPGVEARLEHHGDRLLARTNLDAREFRLLARPVGGGPWRELLPEREGVTLVGLLPFARWLVLLEREGGVPQLAVADPDGGRLRRVALEPAVRSLRLLDNLDPEAGHVRVEVASLALPETVLDVDLDTLEVAVRKRRAVGGGFEPGDYETLRLEATAPDGTAIPISLARRRGAAPGPLLLAGYGAYGIACDPGFAAARLSLLDRGVTIAIAHVRGGGEGGRAWYEAGRLARKENTFHDFLAAARHLQEAGFATPEQTVAWGGSAGGLLVGAAINRAPHRFGGAVALVPFVDALNTMLDEDLPLTVIEYEEWGDPRQPEDYFRILRYAPVEQVREARRPAIWATAGLHDPRVGYWEAARWVLRLRERATGGGPVLLRVEMGAGHQGSSGRYEYLRERARETAFVLRVVGLLDVAPAPPGSPISPPPAVP